MQTSDQTNNISAYEANAKIAMRLKKLPTTPNSQLVRALHYKNLVPAVDKDSKMLDVGCYDGGYMIYFAKYGYKVAGVDIAPSEIELAKSNLGIEGIEPFSLKVMSDETLDFPDNIFDLVLCWKVLHWAGTREKVLKLLKESIRVLKPGKPIFICTLENDTMHVDETNKIAENTYKFFFRNGSTGVIYHFPDVEEYIDILNQNGIGSVEIGSTSGHLLHKPGTKAVKRSLRIFYGIKGSKK